MGTRGGIGIGLLEPVEGRLGGVPLDLGPPKQRLVLAALSLAANHTLPIDRLVDLTWPDDPPPSARTARRVETAALNTLGQVADEPGAALAHHEEALRVATEIGFVAGRIEALIGIAGALGSPEEAARLAREALTLARDTEHRMLEGQALTAIASATSDAAMAAEALAIHRETGYRQGIARTERLLL